MAFHPVDESLIPATTKGLLRAPKRIVEVLKKGSEVPLKTAERSWSLDFCMSPTAFNPVTAASTQLGSISFEKTLLTPDAFDPGAKASGTGKVIDIPSSVAFRSIGYKSQALPGFRELGIPFNNRLGIIPNDHLGRIIEFKVESNTAKQIPGMYCAGWVKRGPTGVIASTMDDAFTTADVIMEDWLSNLPFINGNRLNKTATQGWNAIKDEAEQRGCRRVDWKEWKKLDNLEKDRGHLVGKDRAKFTSIEDMLAVLD